MKVANRIPWKGLFTLSNVKTMKGTKYGWLVAVYHLAPGKRARVRRNGRTLDVCPMKSRGCYGACLFEAGLASVFKNVNEGRIRRTQMLLRDWEGTIAKLHAELVRLRALAKKMGLQLAVRMNGTSDLPRLASDMAKANPDLTFYDYTKIPNPERRKLPNYHLTFSRSESNPLHVLQAIKGGVNVAVGFALKASEALPPTYLGRPVVDGDKHDLRFLDPTGPKGFIIGLRAKGPKAKRDRSGFMVQVAA